MEAIRRPYDLKLTWKEFVLKERSRDTACVDAELGRISLHGASSPIPHLPKIKIISPQNRTTLHAHAVLPLKNIAWNRPKSTWPMESEVKLKILRLKLELHLSSDTTVWLFSGCRSLRAGKSNREINFSLHKCQPTLVDKHKHRSSLDCASNETPEKRRYECRSVGRSKRQTWTQPINGYQNRNTDWNKYLPPSLHPPTILFSETKSLPHFHQMP